MLRFEPGDGYSYRVLFEETQTGEGLLFGIAERGEPGRWAAFDRQVSAEGFFRGLDLLPNGRTLRLALTAWRVWRWLTGQEDDGNAAECLPDWTDGWEAQLRPEVPTSARRAPTWLQQMIDDGDIFEIPASSEGDGDDNEEGQGDA